MKVQVKVNDELVERIDYYAKKMGMTRSSLCAYFIGVGMMSLEKSNSLLDQIGGQFFSNSNSIFNDFDETPAEKK